MKKDDRERCSWATTELYKEYHDEEWGKPVHDDRKLFEMLVLEGMQAGLSWLTILNKIGIVNDHVKGCYLYVPE